MYHNGLKYGYTLEATCFFSDRHVLLARSKLTFFHMSGVLVAYKILETFFNVFLINTHEKSLSYLGKTITIMRKSYNLFAERAT